MSRRLLLAIAAGLLALVAALGATLGVAFSPTSASATSKALTAHPARRDIERHIDASGTLRPLSVVHVGALVSGIVVSTAVEAGDRVRAGELIASIDDSPYRLQLDRARALARAAERRADDARRTLRRQQDLLHAGFVSNAAVESADDVAREAAEDVGVANADVEAARINLAHCRIESPISGTVLSKEVAAGQSVASAFQVPDLFTIVSGLDRLEVVAMFAESDLGQVRAGAPVSLHVPAFPELAFSATVERLLDTPETRQGIVMFPVLLALANERGLLRPGMTAYVEMRVVARAGVLTVPNQALSFARARDRLAHAALRDDARAESTGDLDADRRADTRAGASAASSRRLYVLRSGTPRPVAVKLGAADDVNTEIIPVEALDERDDVLLSQPQ